MPSSPHTCYACHRLIDAHGEIHTSSIVNIDKNKGCVSDYKPFNNEELPFVQWLGGTILLSTEKEPANMANFKTLAEYLSQAIHSDNIIPNSPLYAWHTPLLDIHAALTVPLQPIR